MNPVICELIAERDALRDRVTGLEDQLAQGRAMYDAEVAETDALKCRLTVAATLERQLVARVAELEAENGRLGTVIAINR